jgi:outer membrane protein assembly factor BamD
MCDLKQSPIPDLDQTFTHKAIEELDKVSKIDTTGRWTAAAAQMKLVCMQKLATHDYQVGRFYYKRKIWAGAISRFKKLLESVPDYPQKDAVYFYLGASLVRAFQLTEGKIYLQKVVDDYPKSPYADRARRELAKST